MEISKETLEKLIFIEKKSYIEIGKMFGFSDTYVKKISKSFGITLPQRSVFPKSFVPHNKNKRYSKVFKNELENKCEVCNSLTRNPRFCSNACQGKKNSLDKYDYYLKNQNEFCRADYNPRSLKPFILLEQNQKCIICDCPNVWKGQELIFVLDHVDGDASNNLRNNLRLVCPNCDSQLPTFKSKNKNSARKERYLRNYKS